MSALSRVVSGKTISGKAITDKVAAKAATVYARLTMSSPIYREKDEQFPMRVTAIADLGGGMRRITFSANDFRNFERCGADEYFGLLMPRQGLRLTLPDAGSDNVRAAIAQMPEQERPNLRWYTISAHRPTVGEIDVDIVTHGDSGPGSAWACGAQVGDEVGFRSGGALFRGHECEGPILLVADETALPALAAILEAYPQCVSRATIHIEVADEAMLAAYPMLVDAQAGRVAGGPQVSVHVRGDADPGTAVLAALRSSIVRGFDYAWACGESGLATQVRRHLVNSAGLDRRDVLFSGYWKLGQERG